MLQVIKSINSGGNNLPSLNRIFTFKFDDASTLPVNVYTMGLSTYIIADGSTAINIIDNTTYVYNNGKWSKSNESIDINNDITENGINSIVNNEYMGFNDVDVEVYEGNMPLFAITPTPFRVATNVNIKNNTLVIPDGVTSIGTDALG